MRMKYLWNISFFGGLAAVLTCPLRLCGQSEGPDFKEVYELVREHVPGLSDGGPGAQGLAGDQ